MGKTFMNGVVDHIHNFMDMTSKGLEEMQNHPIGTAPRSTRERNALREKLRALPLEEQNAKLQELVAVAGPLETAKFFYGDD